ncbi:MAG TPA: type B 50S ribosomal protein L31 [Candidatus Paceibacterota bacterium]|jgi:large subunit ribosomal protein L31|nr:type B 50S ribosomal protein L31 [Candidatus Paceibacterota bacterium]
MKKDIHPSNFRDVVFHDNSSGAEFVIASTVKTSETTTHKGKEYPLFRVEISSASHPFYTGTEKVIDTAGRVDRFNKRRAASATKK